MANGDVPDMPEFRFLNIDREQWVNTIDPEGAGLVNIDLVDKSIIRSLRSIFMNVDELKHGLTDNIDTKPTELDGKTVLIVDEVRASGRTLQIAESFIKRAFPETNVAGTHWMKGQTLKGGAVGNADIPVWYKQWDESGRGVGNRDERKSRHSHSTRQRLGGWFLSTALPELDPRSAQLRRELSQLAGDAADHRLLVMPSYRREPADMEERAVRYNGFTNYDEFAQKKREIDPSVSQRRR